MNWSIWNLFNHDNRKIRLSGGRTIYYYLDGKWKVEENGQVVERIDSAVEMAAWLNRNEAEEIE